MSGLPSAAPIGSGIVATDGNDLPFVQICSSFIELFMNDKTLTIKGQENKDKKNRLKIKS